MSHPFPSSNGGARPERCHVLVSPKVSPSCAHTRCIHEISFFFSKCCQGNLPWGLVIPSSVPSIALPSTEVKRANCTGGLCLSLGLSGSFGHSGHHIQCAPFSAPLLCFLQEAAIEIPPIHTDIGEASNSRADTLKSFLFQKKSGHCAGLQDLPKGPSGQQDKSPS